MAHNVKLDTLSMQDLTALITDAQKVLAEKADAKRRELMAEMAKLDELTGTTSKPAPEAKPARQRASPKVTHRSKANPELTWSSRGVPPKWLKAEMAETGLPIDAFKVSE